MLKEYSVYRGDDFLFIGTAKECAERLDITESSFRYKRTPYYKKRIASQNDTGNTIIVVDLD